MPSGQVSQHERAKRGEIRGWTREAVRRHTKWLYSVQAGDLSGQGYAVTLTVKETPPSAAEWQAARRAWLMRAERLGAVRTHWLMEMQRRGTPHLHGAIYFPHELEQRDYAQLLVGWLDVASRYGAGPMAQTIKPIDGPVGWLQYLSKHAARGAAHYQRQGMPPGWEKSGRVWGRTGDWPVAEPLRFDVPRDAYWRYRRLVRSWRVADARAEGSPRRIVSARRMLQAPTRERAEVRGLSEWVPEHVNLALIALLAEEGHDVLSV